MAKDYSDAKLRSELPRVAYTVNPQGILHPLIRGRGIPGQIVEAKVEPAFNMVGGDALLTITILLPRGEPVLWDVLERITAAEIAEGRWLDVAEDRGISDVMD